MTEIRPRTVRTDAATRVYGKIRQRAINYEFRPEERINEVEIAAKMKCSRTPVREALNRLVIEGLVTIVPNKGFFCRAFDADEVVNLFEVRGVLEARAVQLACERASAKELTALNASTRVTAVQIDASPIDELTLADEAFHIRIAMLAGNPELTRMLDGINARIRFVRRIEIENRKVKPFAEHKHIAAAMMARDAARAARLMTEHIELSVSDAVATVKEGLARIYMRKRSA